MFCVGRRAQGETIQDRPSVAFLNLRDSYGVRFPSQENGASQNAWSHQPASQAAIDQAGGAEGSNAYAAFLFSADSCLDASPTLHAHDTGGREVNALLGDVVPPFLTSAIRRDLGLCSRSISFETSGLRRRGGEEFLKLPSGEVRIARGTDQLLIRIALARSGCWISDLEVVGT